MRPWPLLLVLAAACGRVGFDPLGGSGGDAATDAVGDNVDAAPLGAFSTPVLVVELSQGAVNSEDPSLTDDLLEVVFSSTRAGGIGGVDIWTSKRASTTEVWALPVLEVALSSASDDTTPEISGDGLVMVFASSRPGGAGLYDLYLTVRASRAVPWGAPQRIVELSSIADEFTGSIASGASKMIFTSARAGGAGASDLYETVRPSAGPWSPPVAISINSAADESAPWLSTDGRTLYFGSSRAGGQGQQDLWMATRATVGDPWTTPAAVTELNSAENDSDPWLSPDQRTMYYSHQSGSMRNIFMATR